jgi:protein involved in polysaccharide export with SLBB domain
LTAVESLKAALERVTRELKRKQNDLKQRSAGGADVSLNEDVGSLMKLASTLTQMVEDLQRPGTKHTSPNAATGSTDADPRATETSQRPATGKAEPRLFAYARLLGDAPELGVTWSKAWDGDGEHVTLHAPQTVQDALVLAEGYLERVAGSPGRPAEEPPPIPLMGGGGDDPEGFEPFFDLFRPSDDNPRVTMTHSVEAFDKLANYPNAFHDVLMGLAKDPYGPKLPIEAKPIDDGKRLIVTAAQGGQAWLRLMVAEDSPVIAAYLKQRAAAQAAEEAAEQAAEDAAETASAEEAAHSAAVDAPPQDDDGNRPWLWREAQWPAGMTSEDKERVASELAEAGVRVETSGAPESERLAFAVQLPPGQGNHPILIWEEHIIDRQPRKVARVIYEHVEAAVGDAPTGSGDLSEYVDTAAPDSSVERGESPVQLFRVIQPALASGSRVTAYLEVKSDLVAGAEPSDRYRPAQQRESFPALLKSKEVLQAALARPEVRDLMLVKFLGGQGESYLEKQLHVDFAEDSPILALELVAEVGETSDHVKLLDAVIAAYRQVVQERYGSAAASPATSETPVSNSAIQAMETFHRLSPGDAVLVRVMGAPADQPIDGQFEVEEFGTLALGPAYGRIEVTGMTVLEAEAAVTKALAQVLRDPKVQVTLMSRHAADESRYSEQAIPSDPQRTPWGRERQTRAPYRIQSGDELYVDVLGALPDKPIDGRFVVEEEGTLPLGASYGRAKVAGLTVREAEAAVKEELSKVLTSPEVQVTLLSRAKPTVDAQDPNGGGDRYRTE